MNLCRVSIDERNEQLRMEAEEQRWERLISYARMDVWDDQKSKDNTAEWLLDEYADEIAAALIEMAGLNAKSYPLTKILNAITERMEDVEAERLYDEGHYEDYD